MAARKEYTTDVLKDLVANGVPEATFSTEIEWYQSSPQSTRHASSSCYKYTARYDRSTRTKLSPLKVTRACEDCFSLAVPKGMAEQIEGGRQLMLKVRRLESSRASKARDAATMIARCDELLVELTKHHDSELLQPVIESLRTKVRRLRDEQSEVASDVAGELTRFCAVSLTHRGPNAAPCLSNQDSETLGEYERKPVATLLYNEWTREWVASGDADAARSTTIKVARLLKWNERSQLKAFTAAVPNRGESLADMADRVWTARRDEIVEALCTDWEATMSRYLAEGPGSIVAIWGVSGLDNDAEALLSTFKFEAQSNAAVLHVPHVVGTWFAKNSALGYGTLIEVLDASAIAMAMERPLTELSNDWGRVTDGARNALALWDRARDSAYRTFSSAFAAGVRL